MKLYELSQNYNNLLQLLNDELIDSEMIQTALLEVGGSIVDKVQNMGKLIINLIAEVNAYQEETKRLQGKIKTVNNKIDGIRNYIESQLKITGIKKVDGIVPISFRKCPPSVEITNINDIPEKYLEYPAPTVCKKELLEDLKAGEDIPGAILVTDKEHLKIG